MEESSVTFKGTVNGLTIVLREEDDFKLILSEIEKKIASAGKFFKGASLGVRYRGKMLSQLQEKEINKLLVDKSGAEIKSFERDTEESVRVQSSPSIQGLHKVEIKKFFFKGIDEGNAKFHRGTVRSGQLVSADGNLVIIGDVNPGGEVVATGNVVVMGSLRGIVHAGADGNREAVVVAFSLQPTQLKIAEVITRSPDEKDARGNFIPEIAYIKGDMVLIERYLPQYK